jgi:hypothetical protein
MKYLFSILILLTYSCKRDNALETAIGPTGKINIVIPTEQAEGSIGKVLDSLLTQRMTVLPRPEPIFRIRFVNPEDVNRSMRRTRNLIFAFTLNDNSKEAQAVKRMLSVESIKQISEDTSVFMSALSDVYARGQEVVYLFAHDERTLLKKLRTEGQRIADNFNLKERQRINNGILNASTTRKLVQSIEKNHPYTFKIPYGYQLANDQKDFVWFRQINPADDKDIFIASKQYSSADDFKRGNLIEFRNSICRKYLFEDPDQPDTYLVTETSIEDKKVELREFNFGGKYAVEMKGLWKTNVNTMGGPFMGFAFVDEARGMFYYIEGFTYSPSKDQREIMRELESILYSFKVM